MLRSISMFVPLLAFASFAGAEMPSLGELEQRVADSTAMQVLDAQYDAARLRLESEQRRQGASFYSNTTFSDNDEVVDVGRSRSYRQLSSGVGVRVPVLGSRLQWRETLSGFELTAARRDSDREQRRREMLRELRKAYATYWSAQRLTELSSRYVENESDVAHALALRTKAGLLLDSDRLEFLSGFSLAHRDAVASLQDRKQALDTMRLLVNGPVEEGVALRPGTSQACAAANQQIAEWAERAPDVRFLKQAMVAVEATRRDSPMFPVNAEIRAGYHSSTEWPSHEQGGSAAVTLSFDVPINFMSQRRAQQATAASERNQARLEYELRRAEAENELRSLLRSRAVLEQTMQLAAIRLAASDEGVRERELRATKLAGDVIEQLQQARLARYAAAKSALDAELALVHWNADWTMYADEPCRARGLYVWSSQALLTQLVQPATSTGSPPALDQAGISDISNVLVSLDAQQIERYQRDSAPLRTALQAARGRGLSVELLLGEPTWMLPEHRSKLIGIVKAFAGVPFDGVHLDLEPNQLEHTGAEEQALLRNLIDTVRSVRNVSAAPVALSLHPAYLDREVDGRTVGEHFSEIGAKVTLMIYVANPERVVQIAEPLLARYPNLSLRVALSTEETLGREESLYSFDPAERARRIEVIEQRLRSGNFHGITVQPAPSSVRAVSRFED